MKAAKPWLILEAMGILEEKVLLTSSKSAFRLGQESPR